MRETSTCKCIVLSHLKTTNVGTIASDSTSASMLCPFGGISCNRGEILLAVLLHTEDSQLTRVHQARRGQHTYLWRSSSMVATILPP